MWGYQPIFCSTHGWTTLLIKFLGVLLLSSEMGGGPKKQHAIQSASIADQAKSSSYVTGSAFQVGSWGGLTPPWTEHRPTVDISGLICRIFTCRQTELPDFINALQEVKMNSVWVYCVWMFLPQIWNDPMLLWPLTHSASSWLLLRIYLLPMQEHNQMCEFQIRVASDLIEWQRLFSSMFFFFALHTTGWLRVTKITVKNPHAQSFQLLNNTKQTLTYFQSREQAPENTWSGIHPGLGSREERSAVRWLQLLVHDGI